MSMPTVHETQTSESEHGTPAPVIEFVALALYAITDEGMNDTALVNPHFTKFSC